MLPWWNFALFMREPALSFMHHLGRHGVQPVRLLVAVAATAAMAGCVATPPTPVRAPQKPPFYANLGEPGVQLDVADAVQTINMYRQRNGLAPLSLDPDLTALANGEARATAARDLPGSADSLRRSLASRGAIAPMVNMSAGYRTMAEAFSGWRDSPAHNAAMLNPRATRIGIAAATARPGSKYRVYWTLITAGH